MKHTEDFIHLFGTGNSIFCNGSSLHRNSQLMDLVGIYKLYTMYKYTSTYMISLSFWLDILAMSL